MGSEPSLVGAGRTVGRYVLFDEIASGGMATVHLGRLVGPVGFSRTVAIKRLHSQYAKDADFVAMFLDEARPVARIRHPNVVPTLDVVQADDELLLVMEYVQGEALSKLVRRSAAASQTIPIPIVSAILSGVLHGLQAAHEAKGEKGEPLDIVHRDVSPQNVLVGVDGVARLLDFGVAKATQRSQSTRDGQVKGKLSYMAPEQVSSDTIDRRADVFSAGVMLWEALTGERLFSGPTDARVMAKILAAEVRPPSESTPSIPAAFDAICLRALARNPADRYATAREMALAIEKASPLAPASEVGAWVESLAHDMIEARAARVSEIESRSNVFTKVPPLPDAPISGRLSDMSGASQIKPRSRSRNLAIAAIALLVVGAAAAAGFALASRRAAPVAAPAPPPPTAVAPPATVTVIVERPERTPEAPIVANTATATIPPHGVVPPLATGAPVATAISRKAPATATSKSNACSQPFVIDSNGIKHIKPECL